MPETEPGAAADPAAAPTVEPTVENTTTTTVTATAAVTSSSDSDVHKFFTETDFKLDWTNRRKVVKGSLLLLGGLYGVMHMVIAYGLLHQMIKGTQIDPNIVFLGTTLCYTDSALAGTIIMSYVFGANADVKDYRAKGLSAFTQLFSAAGGGNKPS